MLYRVTICTNDHKYSQLLSYKLKNEQTTVRIQKVCKYTLNRMARTNSDMFILGHDVIDMPNTFITTLKELPEHPYIVVLGSVQDILQNSQLWLSGCDQVLYKGMHEDELVEVIHSLINLNIERISNLSNLPVDDQPHISDFISESNSMKDFVRILQRVVKTDVSLLILGETGVGKERLARAMHNDGLRSNGPFIAVNCAALPESLLESELFGHEAGSFTGANRDRKGIFEMAHNGTIFLDEIGDMPLHLQTKLLRVLQEKEFMRIGAEKTVRVDVRIIAATNQNLKALVDKGLFRQDLYYRLSVITLEVPSLKQRLKDIPELVMGFIKTLSMKINPDVKSISHESLSIMQSYSWPGNIRELINVVERAIILCDGDEITPLDLPQELLFVDDSTQTNQLLPLECFIEQKMSWKEVKTNYLKRIEQLYFTQILQYNAGNIAASAKQAGVTTRALYDKMTKYNLDKNDYKNRSATK